MEGKDAGLLYYNTKRESPLHSLRVLFTPPFLDSITAGVAIFKQGKKYGTAQHGRISGQVHDWRFRFSVVF